MSYIPHSDRLIDFTARHVSNTAVSRSLSGTRQAFSYGGGYWELAVSFPPLNYEKAKVTAAFLNSLNGRAQTFRFKLPPNIVGNSDYGGSIFVKGALQVGTQINVDGMAPNQLILKTGDFIKFANADKVYQVAANLVSDSSGEGVLTLHMPVVGSLPLDNEKVVYNPHEVEFTVALSEDTTEWAIDSFVRSQWSLNLEEVWG